MLRALLIDAHAGERAELRELLAAWPGIEIIGEADSLSSAHTLLGRDDYQLVFLDADIDGGRGFDLIASLRSGARAILVAATEAHARRAFDVNALDYLVKPIDPARLAIALSRVNAPTFGASVLASPSCKSLRLGDRFWLNSGTASSWIVLSDIAAIRSYENYSVVHLVDGDRTIVRKTLKAWLEVLPAPHFVQVHRSVVVNLGRVAGCRRHAPKSFSVRIEGIDAPIPVGRGFWRTLKDRLPRHL